MTETLFGVTTYWRENTGTLSCTRDGTATLTAKDGSDTDKIKLTISCEDQPAVSISDWNGDSRTGAGAMSDDFEVSPSNASCSARRSGISASVSITDNRGTDRSVSVTTAGTGTVTVTLTCSRSGYRSASASADFVARKPRVSISGFGGASRDNAGAMTDSFTVSPSSAACTAERDSGIDATVSISGAGTSTRTVTVTTTGTGTVTVEVNCTRSGHTADSDTADFTANAVVVITGFRGDRRDGPGEVSDSFTVSPDDATCTAARKSGIAADVEISGTGSTRTVTVDTEGRTGSVTVEARCTKSGFRTATDTGTFTARPEVVISGLSGRTRTGAGTMTDAFTVSPSNASCTASRSSGISATVSLTDNSGSSRTVSVTTTGTGSVDVRVRCTRSGHASDSQTVTFTANRPRVSISGFGGASRNGPGEMTDHFTVSPTSASCSAQHESGISVALEFTDDTSGSRALKVTTTGTGEASVKVTCTATGHTSASDTATFTARPLVTISGFDGATRTGAGAMTDDFTVSPSNASCTASRSSGISATVTLSDNSGSSRTVSVTTTGTGTVRVRVSCTRTGHVAAADTENFTAEEITVDSVGLVVTSGGECDTDTTPPNGFDGAWDCDMGKGRELVAEVTASGPDSGLSLAWPAATGGVSVSATQGTVQVSVLGTVTTYSRTSTATFECSADGSATVKTSVDGTVAHTGRVGIDCQPPVPPFVLDGGEGVVGDTLLDDFTVSPASATCTTAVSGIAATATFSDSSGTSRELSVTASVPGTAMVALTCDATGWAPTTVTVSYKFRAVVESVEVKATAGGECKAASSTPTGVDDAWDCWMGKGRSLKVVATATDSSGGLSLSWPADARTSGVSLTEDEGDESFNEITGKYQRSNTATFACTEGGSARVVTTLDGAQAHVGLVTIDCRDVVTISGLVDASETRSRGESGAVVVSDEFTVSPSWASCSVAKDSGVDAVLSFPDDSGTSRTVAASISADSGTVEVKVTCSALSAAKNYAPTTVEVDLTLDPVVSVEDVSVRATSGGNCETAAAALPDGVDEGWDCWMGIGRSLKVVATATDPSDGLSLSWPVDARTSGVSLTEDEGDESFSDITFKHQRSNTATFACTEDGSARVVTTLDGKEAHVGLVNIDCRPLVEITGLGGGAGIVRDTLADDFEVTPASASCTASPSTATFSDDSGTERELSVTSSTTGAVTVSVACEADDYAPTTVVASYAFSADVSSVGVSVMSGGECPDASSAPAGFDDAWACWMGIGRQLKVKATASSSDADLSLAWPTVTGGVTVPSSSQGTVQTSSEFGITTYMLASTATIECSDHGSATVESSVDSIVAHTGRLGVDCRPLVEITGLGGGAGIVGDTLTDDFEVTPASVSCTSSPSTATFSDDSGTERELSVSASAAGTVTVSVTCEADDYAPTTVEASYAFSADVDSVGVTVTSGGACPKASSTPAGFDDAWACWMGIGRQLKVKATATSLDADLGIEWPDDDTTGGVTVPDDDEGTVQADVVGETVVYNLSSTATIECSSDGSATVESSVDSIVAHTGRLGVVCRPLVEITDLDDASKTRPRGETGKIAVSEEFTVTPSWASCSVTTDSDSDAMLSFPDDSGPTRTVAASFTALSGMVTVEVTCSAESATRDYAPTTVEADLTLNAAVSVEDVSADATSGGDCAIVDKSDESVMLPEGVDDRWDCWMGKGRSLTVVVTATDASDGMSLSWPADGRTSGLTLTEATEGEETFTERDGKHRRSTTAKFTCTADGAARVVTTLDDEEAHVGLVNIDCRPLVTIAGLHGNAASTQTVTDDFTVSPASATCTPVTSGLAARAIVTPSPVRGSTHRVWVTVTGTATGTVTVEMECSATVGTQKYVPATATAEFVRFDDCTADLGVLGHGSVTRSGTIAVDADCLSWKRGTSSAPNYARRYTFRVPAASRVSVDSTSADVDTYLYVLHGNGSAAEVLGSDNDSHTAGRTDSRVADVRVLPGLTYVVEVTSKPPRQTGPFTLTVTTTPDLPAVKIIGLDPVTQVRNGSRVLADSFTVEPATARCAATAPAAVFAQTGGNRRVSQRMTGPEQATVVVTCSNDGNSDGTARAQFSLWQAVSRVTATALSGGSCAASTESLPTGVDARYACEVSESVTLRVSAETRGAHATPLIGWSATSDVTVTEASAGTPTAVDFATTPIVYTRTGTARVTCTDDGTVTVTVTAGVDIYKVQLDITCGPHPAAHCVDDIGELGEGVTTRSGTIAADAACKSLRRKPGDRRTWYARRHTFSLDAPATVTFVLEGVPAARPGVNVALLLLSGDEPDGTGTRLHFNNNDNSNLAANRLNSRLADVALPKGTYTVEATTWHPWHTGSYTLTINAPAVRDTVAVTTLSGGSCEASEESPPSGIDDLWDCTVQPEGRLRVLATARSGATSFSHAWTVADGVTIPDEPDNPKILARQGPDELDTGWRQSSRIALECTTDGTADLTAGFGTGSGARTRKVRLDLDCNTPVQIKDLVDVTENGVTGETLTLSASFTVEPVAAECTPTSTVGTATVTKPTGGDPDERVVSMSLTVESSATVTVTCAATGRPDGVAKATLRAHQPFTLTVWGDACETVPASSPRSYRCVLSDEHQVTLQAFADAKVSDIKMNWSASGVTIGSERVGALTVVQGPDGAAAGWRRTGSVVARCTADGTVTLSATAGTGANRITRTTPVSIDCQDQGRITGLDNTAAAGVGTVRVADTFTVTPASAPCTVVSTAGVAAVETLRGGAAGDRTVSVALAVAQGADASARVKVDCTPPGHAPVTARATFMAALGDPCDNPLGVLSHGTITRTGVITEDARCISAQRGGYSGGWNQYARRHTFTLDRPADVQIWMNSSASNSSTLDTYVLLLYGHGTNGRVHSRNDDDSSRPRTSNSRLSRETFGPGKYTIEATTSLAGHTGYYDLRVETRLGVLVSGLEDTAAYGTGIIRVADTFTVDPPHAPCTTTAGAITPSTGAERTLTVSLEAGASSNVTVRCDVYFRPEGVATARFTAREAIDSLTVRAVEGGRCERASTTPSDVDAAYECTMAPGRSFVVAADASSPQNGLTVAWSAGGGVTVASQDPGVASPSFGFDFSTTWHRTATATLSCTAAGTVTATASLPGAGSRTARLAVSCRNAVRITGLADQSRTGTGAGRVTDTFTVRPARAVCTSTSGTVTAGAGRARTLSVPLTAPATRQVTVTCTATNRAPTTQTVTFSIVEPCADHLGTLRPGAVTRSGTITTDSSCTSTRRKDNPGDDVFYARRHTFRLAQPARVTIELESAASNGTPLNTYLVLLDGHSPNGTAAALHHNDDVGADRGTLRTNSRLTGIDLAAGAYTIEATTHTASDTGGYDLAVSAVTVSGISTTMHVVQGERTEFRFNYAPTNAVLTAPDRAQIGALVTLTFGGGSGTLTVSDAVVGTYAAQLDIAVPRTETASGSASRGTRGANTARRSTATHAATSYRPGGTVCPPGNAVVIAGDSVCTADSGYRVTIRTPATTGHPARLVPAACISRLRLGRWYLETSLWPASATCNAAVNNVANSIRRRTQFYVFEITASSADVTIRLSSDDRDTHLALWRGSTDPIDTGLLHVDLSTTPVVVNDDAWDTASEAGFLYLDGRESDSRIQTTLAQGVYVISAATLTPPDSQIGHTINIKAIQTSS
ncbi:hypothetical protein [Candidatus Poriferisodalis sp.]|uniref:hypothetical protein n=1 Tax=Candidatus Poriferisodalis sp. TaxID=3101277 RepID=UPI003B02795B